MGIIDGLMAFFKILDALQSEELTEVGKEIATIKKLSLKGLANQDITNLAIKVTESLHKLHSISHTVIKEQNVAKDVAKVFWVDSHFYKENLVVELQDDMHWLWTKTSKHHL